MNNKTYITVFNLTNTKHKREGDGGVDGDGDDDGDDDRYVVVTSSFSSSSCLDALMVMVLREIWILEVWLRQSSAAVEIGWMAAAAGLRP